DPPRLGSLRMLDGVRDLLRVGQFVFADGDELLRVGGDLGDQLPLIAEEDRLGFQLGRVRLEFVREGFDRARVPLHAVRDGAHVVGEARQEEPEQDARDDDGEADLHDDARRDVDPALPGYDDLWRWRSRRLRHGGPLSLDAVRCYAGADGPG